MPPTAQRHLSDPPIEVSAGGAAPGTSAKSQDGAPPDVLGAVEAVLLTLDRPVTAGKVAEALGMGVEDGGAKGVKKAIEALNQQYEATGRAFRIEQVAGGYRVMTLPAFAPAVAKFQAARSSARLTRAGLETLAVIAYRQPVTRAQIEAIRGVACGEVLRNLLERRLISIVGRAEELGRPMLYGVSRQFLQMFGLSSVKDLPAVEDFAPTFESAASRLPSDGEEGLEPGSENEDA